MLVTYRLSNLDPYNALEIGSLSVPLVFQVMPLQTFSCCLSVLPYHAASLLIMPCTTHVRGMHSFCGLEQQVQI